MAKHFNLSFIETQDLSPSFRLLFTQLANATKIILHMICDIYTTFSPVTAHFSSDLICTTFVCDANLDIHPFVFKASAVKAAMLHFIQLLCY